MNKEVNYEKAPCEVISSNWNNHAFAGILQRYAVTENF
jgi:hypothetical protein